MATIEKPYNHELNVLAAEVMDLWQEHLAAYANDPTTKAELMKLLEPQRQLFADWANMMQNNTHGTGFATQCGTETRSAPSPDGGAPLGATTTTSPLDDSALRVAQLAHRVAELEKRVAKLESGKSVLPAKTSRVTKSRNS